MISKDEFCILGEMTGKPPIIEFLVRFLHIYSERYFVIPTVKRRSPMLGRGSGDLSKVPQQIANWNHQEKNMLEEICFA
jgi:hypothetical protein